MYVSACVADPSVGLSGASQDCEAKTGDNSLGTRFAIVSIAQAQRFAQPLLMSRNSGSEQL